MPIRRRTLRCKLERLSCSYQQSAHTGGTKKIVANIMNALDRVLIQKGLFHQGMHQIAVIYTVYYGGFMQAIQVALGVKRVIGDSVGGKCQDHERFLIKVYLSCVRFLHRRFIKNTDEEELKLCAEESPAGFLTRIHSNYSKFRESWEVSEHDSSKMVALFIKISGSFYRCKDGVSKRDYWLLEQESCDWITPWKIGGKTTCLRKQCEQIEGLYRVECISPL